MEHLKSEKPADWVVELVAKESLHMALKGDVAKADWLRYSPEGLEKPGRMLKLAGPVEKEEVWLVRHILHEPIDNTAVADGKPTKTISDRQFDFWIGQASNGVIIWFVRSEVPA
jgi:hypothetical protein